MAELVGRPREQGEALCPSQCLLLTQHQQIGLSVEGIELSNENDGASPSGREISDASASVVIIGMRGSGKTFTGKLAASTLDWSFVDADEFFEQKHQIGIRKFVLQEGWPAFREAETEVLKELLSTYPTRHVISLGGGIVETPSARDVLKAYTKKGPVVHIVRELHEVMKYLGEETARPAYGEPISDVFRRREPWFAECSNYDYLNPVCSSEDAQNPFESVRRDIARFFRHITGQRPNLSENLLGNRRSYFLCLTYPDLTPALPDIEELATGADAIELRVDLLRSPEDRNDTSDYIPPLKYVFSQLAALRRHTDLPIVFTTRTTSEGGKFPSSAIKEAFELFNTAVRHGVEYIDVEMALPRDLISDLVSRKGHSQIIASYHDWSGNLRWDSQVVEEKYRTGASFGDIVKIVGKANVLEDNFALNDFVSKKRASGAKPIIAINMGFEGKISRVLNRTFSPITHPLLPNKAAPGQLSFTEIQNTLHAIGQLPSLRFFLFGKTPRHSLLSTLHKAAFGALGLPHASELIESDKRYKSQTTAILASPDFGGGSVPST